MLSHESIESYYTNNFHVMFHKKEVGFDNHFKLEDWENMLPYEREIYMTMMMNKIEEHSKKKH